MEDGLEFLFRPVKHMGLAPESLKNKAVDLAYVALLNEALDVEAENHLRAQAADRARRAEQPRG